MKNWFTMMVLALASLAGCALQEDDPSDGGSTTVVVTEEETLPAPFRSPAAHVLDFNTFYVSGSGCAELRGTLPGITWESGILLKDADAVTGTTDGWLGTSYEASAGTYLVSYLDKECPGETRTVSAGWAQYGGSAMLKKMKPEDRAYISCSWYDGTSCTQVSDPTCAVKFAMDAQGVITPAGNMEDFTGEEPGCK